MKKQNLTAIILAGGKSSRLWPLENKALIRFGQLTALEHQIGLCQNYTDQIVIVANQDYYEKIQSIINDKSNIRLIIQQGEGMGAAILSCKSVVRGKTIIINAADFFETDLIGKVLKKASEEDNDMIFAAKKMDDYFPGGYVRFEGERVVEIIEKPDPAVLPSTYVKLVVDYFSNISDFLEVLQNISSTNDDQYEKALSEYLLKGKRCAYVSYDGLWRTLKYPWDPLGAMELFLKGIKPHRGENVMIDPTSVIVGDVYIGDNVKIYEYAKIQGPAYIGADTIIGNFALVVESMIGSDCIVGGYTEVTRSLLERRVFLHRNYVGDSILDDEVLMGAGAVLANFRFDQKTIPSLVKDDVVDTKRKKLGAIVGRGGRIGVNASTMPGVKIAAGAIVKPGTVAARDMQSHSA